jgi:hypothetical protein
MNKTIMKAIEEKVRQSPYFARTNSSCYLTEGVRWDKDPVNLFPDEIIKANSNQIETADRILNRNRILRVEYKLAPQFFSEVLKEGKFTSALAKRFPCFRKGEVVIATALDGLLLDLTGESFLITNTDQYYYEHAFPPLHDSICLGCPEDKQKTPDKRVNIKDCLWTPSTQQAIDWRTVPKEYHKCVVDDKNIRLFELDRSKIEVCNSLTWERHVSSSLVYGRNPTASNWSGNADRHLYAHLGKETGKVAVTYSFEDGRVEAPVEIPIREFLILDFNVEEK